jgi:hypothetical protein
VWLLKEVNKIAVLASCISPVYYCHCLLFVVVYFVHVHVNAQKCEELFPLQTSSSSSFSSRGKGRHRPPAGGGRSRGAHARYLQQQQQQQQRGIAHITHTDARGNETLARTPSLPSPPSSRRALRMHMNEDGTRATEWKFSLFGAQRSCAPRVRNFAKVLQLASNKHHPLATKLGELDAAVRRFGYSIIASGGQSHHYPYARKPTEFDDWDLMFRAQGRRRSPEL